MSATGRALPLPAERVAELRQEVHCQVTKMGIKEQIQRCLADFGDRSMSEEDVLQLLEKRGVVEGVMESLQLDRRGKIGDTKESVGVGDKEDPLECEDVRLGRMVEEIGDGDCLDQRTGEETPRKGLHPNKRYLFLRVDGGRAFLDHLQHAHSPCNCHLTLHVCFRGQRVHSRPVPCACEPDFSESFLLELVDSRREAADEGRAISYSDTLAISEPVRLVVTRHNDRGERDLVGTYDIEWRSVLTHERGRWSGTVELSGVGAEAKISSGILDLRLETFPKCRPLEELYLSAQRESERRQTSERERLFLVYSRQWWKEYLQIRAEHAQRMVKIFAMDESGRNRCVCGFVWPLRAGRLLDGPRHAARFVSLIPLERCGSLVGMGGVRGAGEVWSSLHTILCQKKGAVEDHCCLLCSLLLGYGLESYVCVGTRRESQPHCWVVTIGTGGSVVFWESLTGQRYRHVSYNPNTQSGTPPTYPAHPYRTIGCLFNHASFLANTQPSDSALTCCFDLDNRSLWKRMSSEALLSIAHQRKGLLPWSLLPPLLDSVTAANVMEQELRELMTQHRTDLGLSTVWDDTLCYLLSPALASYEQERCGGGAASSDIAEFKDSVRAHVEEGHTFKGFPMLATHTSSRRAFLACLRSPVCGEIAGCRGDQVRLAVRVKVYCYPEDIVAVWIMFAATYCSILCP